MDGGYSASTVGNKSFPSLADIDAFIQANAPPSLPPFQPSSTYASSISRDMLNSHTLNSASSAFSSYNQSIPTQAYQHNQQISADLTSLLSNSPTPTSLPYQSLAASILGSTIPHDPQPAQHPINYLETISNREQKKHTEQLYGTQEAAVRVIASKEQEISRLQTVCVHNTNIGHSTFAHVSSETTTT